MKAIAVAGGTGGVGRTTVEGLVEYGKHKVYVLSRKELGSQGGVDYIKIDYNDPEATSRSLEKVGIHTVISAMGVISDQASQAQKNLIKAAGMASATQRFIISSFDMLFQKEYMDTTPLAKYTFEAIDALEETGLTYTRIANGWFLDYYGMPHWRTHLHPWINIVNMEKKWAIIPGDGSTKANFITTQDMAKFVARLMDLDEWSPVTSIVANTLSFNQLVEMAEKARGSKFQVVTDSLESLKAGKISFASDFPPIGLGKDKDEAFYAGVHYQAGMGRYYIKTEDPLNEKFPDVQITTASEVMESAWKGE